MPHAALAPTRAATLVAPAAAPAALHERLRRQSEHLVRRAGVRSGRPRPAPRLGARQARLRAIAPVARRRYHKCSWWTCEGCAECAPPTGAAALSRALEKMEQRAATRPEEED